MDLGKGWSERQYSHQRGQLSLRLSLGGADGPDRRAGFQTWRGRKHTKVEEGEKDEGELGDN